MLEIFLSVCGDCSIITEKHIVYEGHIHFAFGSEVVEIEDFPSDLV